MQKNILDKLKKIKLFAMDVDGTMTDSGMYYTENGDSIKRFNAKDGMGITLLQKSNFELAIITHSISPIIKVRAEKLKIKYVYADSNNKVDNIVDIAKKLGLELDEIAYIGDDVNDLHALRIVGFSACPNDSVELIKENVDYICKVKGGAGAIREIAELLLKAHNKPNFVDENW